MTSTPTTAVETKRAQHQPGTGSAADELFAVSVHRIAERFRRGREESGLTLRQAAERAGLAPSTIQKIENHKIVPSIAVVVRLAHALNRRASYFIEDDHQEQTDVRLIERGHGRRLTTDDAPVAIEQIAEPLVNPRMEAYLLTVQPGGQSGEIESMIYRGEEIIHCKRGKLRFELRGQKYFLSPGDTLHLKGDIPHGWENHGSQEAVIIIVCACSYS
jgi:transcriptional regulator with XRE-family HTH domain